MSPESRLVSRPIVSSRSLLLALAMPCLIMGGGAAYGQLLGNRPFMNSVDNSLSATFQGARCGDEVAFVFSGKDRATFNKDGVATRLMNNVVTSIRRTCPRVKLVAAKGTVNGEIVYNAVAEGESNWLLLELGSAKDSTLLGGGQRGTSADRANFAKRRDFSAFGAVLTATRGKPYFCSSPQAGTCTSSTEFRNASEDGATVVARSLLDGQGTQAVLTYAAVNKSGLLCSDPQQARIDVQGGSSSPAARTRMATDLRERLKPYGNQVCSGYALRGPQIITASFDSNGARIGPEALLSAGPSAPKLRQEK